jgi:hypothetical protein
LKPRSTLKSYFIKGAIPKESDFADLIDSMLIQDEDAVFKTANDPLSIKATGAEEALLNFYRAEQGNNTLTWQMKQKPNGAKPGLSIADSAGTRLYIESGSGNVGIGLQTPKTRLHVQGRLRVSESDGANGSGVLELANGSKTNYVFTDGATGHLYLRTDTRTNHIILQDSDTQGNVGIGTTDVKAKLTVRGDLIRKVAIATGLGPGDDTNNGQINSRVLSFTKQYADTAIRILYCDNLRVNGADVAARWEIRIDGKSVPGGAIYQDKYGSAGNYHEPATIIGYAQGVGAGTHAIQVWVGPSPGFPRPWNNIPDAFTGWEDSRWTIEAQEVWI